MLDNTNQDELWIGNVICPHCGEKDNHKEVVTDMINSIVTEKDRICNNCDKLIDFWAYGHWESSYGYRESSSTPPSGDNLFADDLPF